MYPLSHRRPSSGNRSLDAFLFEESHKLRRLSQTEQSIRDVGLLGELSNLAEHREILIRYLERRRDDEEEKVHRLLIDGLEVQACAFSSERNPELVHHQRAAMRDRDSAADTR